MGKPNILLIMTDQHRADWIGVANPNLIDTPHIDSIAQNGTYFPNAVCNSPVCAPSRISMATGKYPHRLGALNNETNMDINETTYFAKLREGGYRVGVVGKTDLHKADHFVGENGDLPFMYHVGFTDPLETEGKGNAARQTDQSFEVKKLRGPYQKYLRERGLLEAFTSDYRYRYQLSQKWYAAPSVLPVEDFHDSYIGRKACEFIENVSNESPWHLFVSFVGPHNPWDSPEEYWRKYADKQFPPAIQGDNKNKPRWIQQKAHRDTNGMTMQDCNKVKQYYAGAIKLIDDWVGRLLAALKKRDMDKNTIVIFCSDHGEMLGDHGLFYKSVMYEGSIRVPLIINDPRSTGRGRSEELVELVDLYPTILELADIPSGGQQLDGKSLLPSLTGSGAHHKDYQISTLLNTRMIFDGTYKLIENFNDVTELYDVVQDPFEIDNIFEQRPEIAKKLKKNLTRLLT